MTTETTVETRDVNVAELDQVLLRAAMLLGRCSPKHVRLEVRIAELSPARSVATLWHVGGRYDAEGADPQAAKLALADLVAHRLRAEWLWFCTGDQPVKELLAALGHPPRTSRLPAEGSP